MGAARPPVIARALMKLLVPRHLYEAIAGDIEEQWHAEGRNRRRCWTAVLVTIADCSRDRLRAAAGDGITRRRGDGLMRSLFYDVKYAGRMMRRDRGVTLAAVLTLGLGIGATSAIFSLVNVFTLKPLGYRSPSDVVFVFGRDNETGTQQFSLPLADFLDIRRQAKSLASVTAYSYVSANLTGGDLPERVQAYRVTANTFEMLGVGASLGRTFTSDNGVAGRDRVAVISDGLWRRRFGADPAAVGRQIMLNGVAYEIVGVMPRRFEYPVFNFKGDLWVPWVIDEAAAAARATSGTGTVVARIAGTADLSSVSAELDTIMRRLAAAYPATNGTRSVRVVEMGKLDDEEAGLATLTLPLTAVLVLLLACANVANLLLARGVSRTRELAVRAAVGATRWRIARQLLVESCALGITGAIVGLALARVALEALKAALPEIVLTTMPNILELGIDRTTLGFTMATAGLSTLLFGVLPAWRAARPASIEGLREGASAGGSRGTRRLRTALVVGEVTLATMLVVVSALLVRSYAQVQHMNPGFAPQQVLTMAMTLPENRYPTPERRRQFYDAAVERVQQLPGVRSAAFVNVLPFSTYDRGMRLTIEGLPVPPPGREPHTALRIATPGYFATLQIPLRAGRLFDARDGEATARVAVVNETFARRHLGGSPAEGRRFRFAGADGNAPWIEIVGTIGDVHHADVTQPPSPELYVPLSQAAGTTLMMLAVRGEGRPEDLIASVRVCILDVDPQQPVYHLKSMERLLADSLLPRSAAAAFMGGFSVLALLLALIGVYGVVSYGVTQQMPEFGVRLALGATPGSLVRRVLRTTALMTAAGLALGLAAAAAVSGVLEALLYGVGARDLSTYVGTAAVLFVLALLACAIPAWRASSAEPLRALRAE